MHENYDLNMAGLLNIFHMAHILRMFFLVLFNLAYMVYILLHISLNLLQYFQGNMCILKHLLYFMFLLHNICKGILEELLLKYRQDILYIYHMLLNMFLAHTLPHYTHNVLWLSILVYYTYIQLLLVYLKNDI